MPDHSTFSKNRHGRFRESDLLRHVFETVVRRCIEEGLVGGEGFAVDASLIKADANRQKGVEGTEGLPPEVIEPRGRRVSGRARRRGVRRRDRGDAEVHLAGRSGGALDRRPWRAGLLRLFRQLPDRPRPRRSSSMSRPSTAIRQAEVTAAKTHDRAARSSASTSTRRGWPATAAYGSAEMLQLAGPRARHRAPHSGVRQVQARPTAPSRASDFAYDHEGDVYRLPGRQDADLQPGTRGERRHDAPLPRQQARLRRLRAEAALLPEGTGPQGAALHL